MAGPSLTQRQREQATSGRPDSQSLRFFPRPGRGSECIVSWLGSRTGSRDRGRHRSARPVVEEAGKGGARRGRGGSGESGGGGGGGRDLPAALGSPASVAAGAGRHCRPGAEWHPGVQHGACSSVCVTQGERRAGPSLQLAPPGRGACSPPATVCREAGGP